VGVLQLDTITRIWNLISADDTCQAVSEAGATSAVMSVMTSYLAHAQVQRSCCWALASLSRAGESVFFLMAARSRLLLNYYLHVRATTFVCIRLWGKSAAVPLFQLGSY